MSNNVEFEGQTEDEAVAKAVEALKMEAAELEYEVEEEGEGEAIKIRVLNAPEPKKATRKTGPAPEKAKQAVEVTETLLQHMGLEGAVISVEDGDEEITVKIEDPEGSTEISELFCQSRPPAIPALQFLLNKIVNRFPEDRKHIMVDMPAVPKRERPQKSRSEGSSQELDPDLDPTLVALGRLLAERSQSINRVLTVFPMQAGDRRAIHQTVTVTEGASTVSEGEGLYRRLHVVPASMKPAGGKSKRRRRRRRRRPEGEERTESAPQEAVEYRETT